MRMSCSLSNSIILQVKLNGTLIIEDASTYDSGLYECTLHNTYYTQSASATVSVKGSVGNCDFEGGLCNFRDGMDEVDFFWSRNTGSTGSWGTGPVTDHTLGTDQGIVLANIIKVIMFTVHLMKKVFFRMVPK